MKRNTIILILGIIIIIMPFLGFPNFWRTFFYVVAGMILIVMAAVSRVESADNQFEKREVVTEVFVETNGTDRV